MNQIDYLDDRNEEIDLIDVLKILWSKRLVVILITSLFSLSSILYALSIQDIYTSHAKLYPASNTKNKQNISSQLSGLAGLAGISMPDDNSFKSIEGIEYAKSFKFFKELSSTIDLLPGLMAAKRWDPEKNIIIYDDALFNIKNNEWLIPRPSELQSYRAFSSIFSINQDAKTSLITMQIDHISPYVAKAWLDKVILLLNKNARNLDKNSAQKALDFLTQQFTKNNINEIKEQLASSMQQQIQTLVLIEAEKEYLFKILEPPYVPDLKTKPNRSYIVLILSVIGMFVSFFISLSMHYLQNKSIKI